MNIIKKHLFITFLTVFITLPIDGFAKFYIDISGPGGRKIPIAVQELKIDKSKFDPERTQELKDIIDAQLLFNLNFARYFDIIEREAFIEDVIPQTLTARKTNFQNWRLIGAELLIKGGVKLTKNRVIAELRVFDTITGDQIMGKRYFTHPDEAQTIANDFADDVLEKLTGTRGIFSTKILFTSKQTGNKEIYLTDFNGRKTVQLTNNRSINLSPKWHPGGEKFLYTSYKDDNPNLYEQVIRTGKNVTISKKRGFNLGGAYSKDGADIALALSKDGNSEIYLLDMKGESLKYKRLTNQWGIDVSPEFAPDNKSLIFMSDKSGNPNIYMINLTDGKPVRLSFGGGYNGDPAFSPDGSLIAYARMKKGRFNIFVMDKDGYNPRQLTFEGTNKNPSWSPDGRYITFSSERNGEKGLYIMSADGQMIYKVPTSKSGISSPDWSPYLN